MNSELIEISNRLVKSSNFYWNVGMRAVGVDVLKNKVAGTVWLVSGHNLMPTIIDEDGNIVELIWAIPDLEDPATIGCIQAVTRVAYEDPGLYASTDGEDPPNMGWWIKNSNDNTICCFDKKIKEENKSKYGRCCVGGPCFEPSWGKTEGEAWAKTLVAKNK